MVSSVSAPLAASTMIALGALVATSATPQLIGRQSTPTAGTTSAAGNFSYWFKSTVSKASKMSQLQVMVTGPGYGVVIRYNAAGAIQALSSNMPISAGSYPALMTFTDANYGQAVEAVDPGDSFALYTNNAIIALTAASTNDGVGYGSFHNGLPLNTSAYGSIGATNRLEVQFTLTPLVLSSGPTNAVKPMTIGRQDAPVAAAGSTLSSTYTFLDMVPYPSSLDSIDVQTNGAGTLTYYRVAMTSVGLIASPLMSSGALPVSGAGPHSFVKGIDYGSDFGSLNAGERLAVFPSTANLLCNTTGSVSDGAGYAANVGGALATTSVLTPPSGTTNRIECRFNITYAEGAERAFGLAQNTAAIAALQSSALLQPTYWSGVAPANTRHLKRAIATVKSGSGRGRIIWGGDSTTDAGHGGLSVAQGGDANSSTNCRFYAMNAVAARALAGANIPCRWDSIFGNSSNGIADTVLNYGTALTVSADWDSSVNGHSNVSSLGGSCFESSGTGTWSYNPPQGAWNTCELFYATQTGGGSFNYWIGGGSTTSVSTNAAAGVSRLVISTGTTAAVQALNIARTTGGSVLLVGAIFYDSAVPQLDMINIGWGGSASNNWSDNTDARKPYTALATLAAGFPCATFLNLGINDWIFNSISAATVTQVNLTSTITQFLISGDVFIQTPFPSDPSKAVAVSQLPFIAAIKNAAASAAIPVLDAYNLLWEGTNSIAVANGFGYSDEIHLTMLGYDRAAQPWINLIRSV